MQSPATAPGFFLYVARRNLAILKGTGGGQQMAKASSKKSPRVQAARGKSAAPSGTTAEGPEAKVVTKPRPARRKQAVVIVHGMGEQRPLETLRAFVEAVWGSRPTPRPEPSEDDIWLVPDHRAGLTELARVTTRANSEGVATDFYELYWSDLLVDNKLSQIKAWLFGLLWRWPHQVPRETFVLWITLWAIVGAIAGLAFYVGLTSSIDGLKDLVRDTHPVQNAWTLCASIALTVMLWAYFWLRLRGNLRGWTNATANFPGIWSTLTPAELSMDVALSRVVVLLLPPAVGLLAFLFFPWPIFLLVNTWLLALGALVVFALGAWVVPVFGDVARYVRTSPDAVSARAEIRERGVALLHALHGAPVRPDRYDFGNPANYERIVVVGHSLGSIIAYDVLRLYWQEAGPTGPEPVRETALEALRKMDEFCRQQSANPEKFDIAGFRSHQAAVSASLAQAAHSWRITDFVTLGSPLGHAEFLISRDRAAFEERKAERLFPTCPPMLEPGRNRNSFLYPRRPGDFAHHAAMFAAMRWTNIHDPDWLPFRGDFIGGPCSPNFGPGVIDLPVRIDRDGPFGRCVTHTDYWNPGASGSATDAVGERLGLSGLSGDPKAHISLLRKALSLR